MQATTTRHFTTYSGVKLPFKLVSELTDADLRNRNTFFRGYFDSDDRLLGFDKLVYGEIELAHRYEYDAAGTLRHAEITDVDGDVTELSFDASGSAIQ